MPSRRQHGRRPGARARHMANSLFISINPQSTTSEPSRQPQTQMRRDSVQLITTPDQPNRRISYVPAGGLARLGCVEWPAGSRKLSKPSRGVWSLATVLIGRTVTSGWLFLLLPCVTNRRPCRKDVRMKSQFWESLVKAIRPYIGP